MHILIAPNALKNSIDARTAAEAIRKGLESSALDCTTDLFPIGDGGDGTARIITEKFNGTSISLEVHDPLGRKIKSSFGLIEGGQIAVIEMADASGLRLLHHDELNPFKTSSFGTGEMILAALDKGVTEIIIGLGGSATIDGAAGILSALGLKFLDKNGGLLEPYPESLHALDQIDASGVDRRIFDCKITVLCDVDNYLLGEDGAVPIFGSQKGAKKSDFPKLEQVLSKMNDLLKQNDRKMDKVKHGGAAGGAAAGLYAFLNAELVDGAERFLNLTDFDDSLNKCDILITGEGSLDEQTLQGKAPYAVANRAKKKSIPVIGFGGKVPLENNDDLNKYFDVLVAIGHQPSDLTSAIADTRANLVRTGTMIGNLLVLSKDK